MTKFFEVKIFGVKLFEFEFYYQHKNWNHCSISFAILKYRVSLLMFDLFNKNFHYTLQAMILPEPRAKLYDIVWRHDG